MWTTLYTVGAYKLNLSEYILSNFNNNLFIYFCSQEEGNFNNKLIELTVAIYNKNKSNLIY